MNGLPKFLSITATDTLDSTAFCFFIFLFMNGARLFVNIDFAFLLAFASNANILLIPAY